MLTCLVCEQLWRRQRMSLNELLQAIAQVCAADTNAGLLPTFRLVSPDGRSKQEANDNRRQVVNALKILVAEGTITVDADLDRVVDDEHGNLVVSCSRERLACKFSSLGPTLLGLDGLPPARHADVLAAGTLPTDTVDLDERPTSVDDRRLRALRRIVDDPATDPGDDDLDTTAYLHTISGRERALNVAASLGLVATVRRDWWEITDPHGTNGVFDFPKGRRTERQAALAVLAEIGRRPAPTAELPLAEITAMIDTIRETLPRWAAAYHQRPTALARAAATDLTAAGLLRPDVDSDDVWHPTPGVHLWRVRVTSDATKTGRRRPTPTYITDPLITGATSSRSKPPGC